MKKTISLLLALLLVLSLCACGSDASKPAAAEQKSAAVNGASYDMAMNDVATEESIEMEYAYGLSPAEEPAPDADYAPAEARSAAGSAEEKPAEKPDKIIYSANVQVETTDFDGTLSKLDRLVAEYGGWVESSSINGNNYADRSRGRISRRSAGYTLRIPSERFQELMDSLSELGNVPYSYVYTENVTAQYYDVQARLTAYTTQEQRLLEMMELAESVEDIILLEDRLTEVRYRIESLQTSLNNWDRRVSYSTVYLDISEVQEYSPEPQVQPSFGQMLGSALRDGLRGVGDFFKNLLLWLTSALPALILILVLIVILVLVLKKRRRNRRAAKAAPSAPVTQTPPAQTREEDRKE